MMLMLRKSALLLAAISLAGTVLAGTVLAADNPAGDLFTRLQAKVKPGQPFQLLVKIQLKAGTEEKFAAAASKAVKETAAEPGCGMYELFKDQEQPDMVVLFEKWKSIEALKTHLAQPYTVALLKVLGEIGAEPDIRILAPFPAPKSAS